MIVGETSYNSADVGKRDAFHVPGVLVTSKAAIKPGEHVRFIDGSASEVRSCLRDVRQGVADPFIKDTIPAGSTFWMFLEPSIVGNLCHFFEIEGVTTVEPVLDPPAKTLDKLQEQLEAAEKRVEELEEKVREHEDYDDGCRGCY